MTTSEVIEVLARGRVRRGVTITVPEGWRAEEIAWKLDSVSAGSGATFLAEVGAPDSVPSDWQAPVGAGLEGFLFPDTYEWRPEQGVSGLVSSMLGQFGRVFDARRRIRAGEVGFTVFEVVTLASIVEREAVVPDERPLIAGVYRNRLRQGMPLQADPTVQYAIAPSGIPAPSARLWKSELSLADLQAPSAYNTYQRRGLPNGPICNPGLPSIDAVLHPETTDALYFVAREDGRHVFARTADEHFENVRRYQRGPR
jgi:UPF0755 protein